MRHQRWVRCAMVWGMVAAALGSGRLAMGRPYFEETLTREGVRVYAKLLGMDAEQTEYAKTLFDGYLTAAQRSKRANAEAYKRFSERPPRAIDSTELEAGESDRAKTFRRDIEEWTRICEEHNRELRALRDGFFEDLRLALNKEQEELWPRVERKRRRDHVGVFEWGMNPAGPVDMFELVDRLELPGPADHRIERILDSYDVDLDRALREHERVMRRILPLMQELSIDGNPMRVKKLQTDQTDIERRARRIHKRCARELAEVLGPEHGPRLDAMVRKALWPCVYGAPSRCARLLEAALGLDDLTAAQREALERLDAELGPGLDRVNQRWAEAIDVGIEAAGPSFGAELGVGGFETSGPMAGLVRKIKPPHPAEQARQTRIDLERATEKQIRETLTPEQYD